MTESFCRWESDPLFSAAEVVQDSADRMESVFRMLLNEEKLVQGCSSDTKVHVSLQYHKRDLVTALETTRWQLEDFERAVSLAALSDKSNSRENAISKFRQFVIAIREQIDQVEGTVKDSSMGELNKSSQSMNSNEHDTDVLASFLSGGDSRDHRVHYDSESSIMKRFLNSATDSDEIIELTTEDVEVVPTNALYYSDCGYDQVGKRHAKRDGELTALFEGSKDYDPEFGYSQANCYPSTSMSRGSSWRLLRNFWLPNRNRASFTKRRKDGELAEDSPAGAEKKISPSIVSITPSEQGKCLSMGCIQGSKLDRLINALHLHCSSEAIERRLRRSRCLILSNRFPIRLASAVLIALTVLGFVTFRMA